MERLSPDLRAVLEHILASYGVPGADASAHVKRLWMQQGCQCGCATVDLTPDEPTETLDRLPEDLSALLVDPFGQVVGEVLVLVRGGTVARVEFSSYGGEPIRKAPGVADLRVEHRA